MLPSLVHLSDGEKCQKREPPAPLIQLASGSASRSRPRALRWPNVNTFTQKRPAYPTACHVWTTRASQGLCTGASNVHRRDSLRHNVEAMPEPSSLRATLLPHAVASTPLELASAGAERPAIHALCLMPLGSSTTNSTRTPAGGRIEKRDHPGITLDCRR